MAKDKITKIGKHVSVFKTDYTVSNLRRTVDVELAQRSEKHQDAAKRADVTPTWWSRIVNGNQITENDLKTIAKGIGFSLKRFKTQLNDAA